MSQPTLEELATDFEGRFLEGFAVLLAAAEVGKWQPETQYGDADTGIVLGGFPQTPDRVLTLSAYGVDDSPSLSDSVLGLQVRTRWEGEDARGMSPLASAVYNELHGRTGFTLSTGVRVVQCLRRSYGSLGIDDSRRWRETQNFYVTVHRPSKHRQ